jgi:hypothetical protein
MGVGWGRSPTGTSGVQNGPFFIPTDEGIECEGPVGSVGGPREHSSGLYWFPQDSYPGLYL